MNVYFNDTTRGKAQVVAASFRGQIIAWGFAPFWLSTSRQVENLGPTPAGGANFEARDGLYITTLMINGQGAFNGPMPWDGDVYVMNGTGANDQLTNVVNILLVPECPKSN